MVKILFITLPDGERHEIEAEIGGSIMEIAVQNGIERIIAECGGACSCATCHVYIDKNWTEKISPPDILEEDMLTFVHGLHYTSRLSCQIRVNENLDGLVVYVP